MGTDIRPEISKSSKYWISRHRFYELKHYCLQYPEWKKIYSKLETNSLPKGVCLDCISHSSSISNPTAEIGVLKAEFSKRMNMIEITAQLADPELSTYIFKAVTEATPFSYLQTVMNIPCCRETFYERYRRFFWLLSSVRG